MYICSGRWVTDDGGMIKMEGLQSKGYCVQAMGYRRQGIEGRVQREPVQTTE